MRLARRRWKVLAVGLVIPLLALSATLVVTLWPQGRDQAPTRPGSVEMRVLLDQRLGLYRDRDGTMPAVSLNLVIPDAARGDGPSAQAIHGEVYIRNESGVGLLLVEPCGDVTANEVRVGSINAEVIDLSGESLGHICGRPMVDIEAGETVRAEINIHDLTPGLDATAGPALVVFEAIERSRMLDRGRVTPDLAVGVPGGDTAGAPQAGRVSVYSGAGERLVHQLDGVPDEGMFGFSVDISGDVDSDGVPDLVVGAPFGGRTAAGRAYLYSGGEGELLLVLKGESQLDEFGFSVSFLGDVDGDGVADLAIGAPFATPAGMALAGRVYVYSGASGSLVYSIDGKGDGDKFGWSLRQADDLDSDGVPDFVAGAPFASPSGLFGAGSAYVYSGATGTLIRRLDGTAPFDQFGMSLSSAGDLDADGLEDIIVGAPGAAVGDLTGAGSAFIYSGATGALIHRLDGEGSLDHFGESVSAAGDVNADGVPDLLVGAPRADPDTRLDAGSAYIYSGFDGSLILRLDGEALGDEFGRTTAFSEDLDGDSTPDLIVGAQFADPGGRRSGGSIYLYSGTDGSLIRRLDGWTPGDRFGTSLSGLGP